MPLLEGKQAHAIKSAARGLADEDDAKLLATIINLMVKCNTPEQVFDNYGKYIPYDTAVRLAELAGRASRSFQLGSKISALIKRMTIDPTIVGAINSASGYSARVLPDYELCLQRTDSGKEIIVKQGSNMWYISDTILSMHCELNGSKLSKDPTILKRAISDLFGAYGKKCDIEIVPLKARLVKLIVK